MRILTFEFWLRSILASFFIIAIVILSLRLLVPSIVFPWPHLIAAFATAPIAIAVLSLAPLFVPRRVEIHDDRLVIISGSRVYHVRPPNLKVAQLDHSEPNSTRLMLEFTDIRRQPRQMWIGLARHVNHAELIQRVSLLITADAKHASN